jgi:hypothetical protein
MIKNPIRIIKRKDAEAMVKTRRKRQPAPVSKEQVHSRSQRNMKATVSSWVTGRRQLTRSEEIAAVHKVFGNGIQLGTT